MKILVFSPYYPPHIGGLETHSEEFNTHLAKNGVDVVLFTPRLPTNAPETEEKNGVKILRFPAFEIISNYPVPKFWSLRFWKIYGGLFKKNPDIVVSRTRFFLTSLLALIYAKMRRIPLIHIEHGSDFVEISSKAKTFLAKIYDLVFGRFVFRHSSINISISEAVQKFVRKFDDRESPVIYRGLDFNAIDAIPENKALREKYAEKIILATAARLYKWKGIKNTIEAIRTLPDDLKSKIVFLIIGDGEEFGRLKKQSTGLPIEMLGRLPRERAIGILKASDIYIHSSLPGGGLSTSLLEAMYCGCAVIATPNEGAAEIIQNKENGILIENSSPDRIKKAIINLLNKNDSGISLKRQAKQTVSEKFSWDRSISAYIDIFKML